jgi:hypothetical protein
VPIGHHLLLASLAIDAKLLALGHAVRLNPVGPDLLALGHAGLPRLNVLRPVHMPVGNARLSALDTLRAGLMALGDASALRSLDALRARLTAFRALFMLSALRPFGGNEVPGVLDARRLEDLALRPSHVPAATAAPALHLRALTTATAAMVGDRRLAILTPTTVGPRTCRGCDRKRCNARCEKHPGHH